MPASAERVGNGCVGDLSMAEHRLNGDGTRRRDMVKRTHDDEAAEYSKVCGGRLVAAAGWEECNHMARKGRV